MHYRIEVAPLPNQVDARGKAVVHQAETFLGTGIRQVTTRDVYSLFADINDEQAERIAAEFTNPVIQQYAMGSSSTYSFDWLIMVGYLPGVTDNVARTAHDAIRDIIGRPLRPHEAVFSSVEYLVSAPAVKRQEIERIAEELLANRLIQSIDVRSAEDVASNGIPVNRPEFVAVGECAIETIDLDVTDGALQRISDSRTLALSLGEMKAIQGYFLEVASDPGRIALGLGAQPTDAELEAIAQTWSEHCKHKIFDAIIDYEDDAGKQERIDSCFKSFIRKSTEEIGKEIPWLRSVFVDNAGVIGFNDKVDLVYKVETHNSPSALDPYGGAMTGIVGVNRDPLGTGMGANLLINVWGYCLASPFTGTDEVPEGLLHPRRIRDGVHQGVIEGGNQSGIPYGYGWEFFEPRYLGKPLVFCGTVGLLPRTLGDKPGHAKSIQPGDLIVMAGGRIGKDGIHGATFSSEELHAESPAQAVQIGDPITQKKLADFTIEARDKILYRFITDNGAGGLSSSIGEMATQCGGCDLDLAKAPLKYQGLRPWEILVSESQERMSYAVPPECIAEFRALAARREVEVTVLGTFTDSGYFHIRHGDATVVYVKLDFLHDGYPRLQLKAKWQPPVHEEPEIPHEEDVDDLLRRMIGRLNVCSGEKKARQYDHEVKGLSVIKPFVGVANDVSSDATLFMVEPLSKEGIILSYGIQPRYSDIDTYHMTASVIDLALRRIIAVGGKLGHIAALDNFCWPDPVQSEKTMDGEYKLAQLVRANQALYDYTRAFKLPCVSGKDSMKNDSTRGGRKISIPPTLLFSAVARMEDITKAVTIEAKRVGDLVYVIGDTHRELGGSELFAMLGAVGNDVPRVNAAQALITYEAISKAIEQGLCRSVHTPALGGLAIGFAKVAMGGRLGMEIDLAAIPRQGELEPVELLFSESNSRFIVTLSKVHKEAFEALLNEVPHACVGTTTYDNAITFYDGDSLETAVELEDLIDAYKLTLSEL